MITNPMKNRSRSRRKIETEKQLPVSNIDI